MSTLVTIGRPKRGRGVGVWVRCAHCQKMLRLTVVAVGDYGLQLELQHPDDGMPLYPRKDPESK